MAFPCWRIEFVGLRNDTDTATYHLARAGNMEVKKGQRQAGWR
jgi:hypothetical protein